MFAVEEAASYNAAYTGYTIYGCHVVTQGVCECPCEVMRFLQPLFFSNLAGILLAIRVSVRMTPLLFCLLSKCIKYTYSRENRAWQMLS